MGNRIDYKGEYKDGKWHGHGTIKYQNGDQFVGDFQEGQINGKGVYTWKDGKYYTGEFSDGKRQGEGMYVFPDVCTLYGKFDHNVIGEGVQINTNGDRYEGHFYRTFRDGYGVCLYNNGHIYTGNWKNE